MTTCGGIAIAPHPPKRLSSVKLEHVDAIPPISAEAIHGVAATVDFSVKPEAVDKLRVWLDQLVVWNAQLDLTAAGTESELLDIMLVDALILAKRIPTGLTVVDVGTGAGAPGLALAILRPDLRVTLVEPLVKRVAFLRTALSAVGRDDIALLRMRSVELKIRWDVAMARATFPPPDWLEEGSELVRTGGSVWVFLAKERAPELDNATLEEDVTYVWPGTKVGRRAVRYVIS
jgi:16S rRNA (guanine527-N7)-methyltransferase